MKKINTQNCLEILTLKFRSLSRKKQEYFSKDFFKRKHCNKNFFVGLDRYYVHIWCTYTLHTVEKHNTTHLFYHRFRGVRFINTLKDATKRRRERGKTDIKNRHYSYFLSALIKSKVGETKKNHSPFNRFLKIVQGGNTFLDFLTVYTRHFSG